MWIFISRKNKIKCVCVCLYRDGLGFCKRDSFPVGGYARVLRLGGRDARREEREEGTGRGEDLDTNQTKKNKHRYIYVRLHVVEASKSRKGK